MESQKKVLIVDDNPLFRKAAAGFFGDRFKVLEAGTCAQGQELLGRESVDLAILDERLPDGSGLDLCRNLFQLHPFAKVIYVTAFPSFDHAVNALKVGAHDYLSKPFEVAALGHAVDRLMSVSALERAGRLEAWRAQADSHQAILVGRSARMSEIRRIVHLAAGSDASVLITGETGTGKGLVARAIHHASPRTQAPFVTINCSALPENLIEAELFGWTRGAFTGAVNSREGVLEMAEGGTLFLDEIGEMPMHLQVKLLSVLEDHMVTPWVAGWESRSTSGSWRPPMPSSRRPSRPASSGRICHSASTCSASKCQRSVITSRICRNCAPFSSPPDGSRSAASVPQGELALLAAYAWPGNVRELKNVLERA